MRKLRFHHLLMIFIFSLVIISTKSDECETLIKQYINNYNPLNINNPLVNTGMGYNDLGKYDACVQNSTNGFIVSRVSVNVTATTQVPVYLGLCLPDECLTESKINEYKSKLEQKFNITDDQVEIIESQKENSKYQTWDASSIIILLILITYLLFASGLVKIFYDMSQGKGNKKGKDIYQNGETTEDSKSLTGESRLSDAQSNLLITSQGINDRKSSVRFSNSHTPDETTNSTFGLVLDTCFDVTKNFNKIFNERETEDKDLKVFDGLRVITCVIIIISHVCSTMTEMPIRNPDTMLDYIKSFIWQFFFNAVFTVDVFFALSGFFIAYMTLKNIEAFRKASFSQLLLNIVLRLLRIWPIYSLVFLYYWKFYSYVLDGPLSGYVFNKELDSCNSQWPFMLTLLTNFTYGIWETSSSYCMGWYWYVPNDFQYSIIAIFLLVAYARNKKLFYVLFGLVNLSFWAVEAVVTYNMDIGVNLNSLTTNQKYFQDYYVKFYIRSSPFWIGLWFGIIYANFKSDVKLNEYSKTRLFFESLKDSKIMSAVFYFIGVFIMLGLTFSTYWSYDTEWSFAVRFLYNILSKKLYVIGLFMFCFPLMLGNFYFLGGWLGHSVFLPLARLSFAVYIIHPLVINYVIYNVRYPLFFNGLYIIVIGISFTVFSYLLAVFVSTLFEMPFQSMRDLLKRKLRSNRSSKDNITN